MKIKIALLTSILVIMYSFQVTATEIGFTAGIIKGYSGSVELSGGNEPLESYGMPTSIFVLNDKIRYSYDHYEQYTSGSFYYATNDSTYTRQVVLKNDVFSVSYQADISKKETFDAYANAGIGLFQSSRVYTSTVKGYHLTSSSIRKSGNDFDIGLVLSAGAKKAIKNSFIGAELKYFIKEMTYEAPEGYTTEHKHDIGGYIVSVTTGVSF